MIKSIDKLILKLQGMLTHFETIRFSRELAQSCVEYALREAINLVWDLKENYTPWVSVKDKPYPTDTYLDIFTTNKTHLSNMWYCSIDQVWYQGHKTIHSFRVAHWMYITRPQLEEHTS